MNYDTDPGAPILVAISDEWRDEFSSHFTELGYRLLFAMTREDALRIIQSRPLSGLLVTTDFALSNENEKKPGLMEFAIGKIPSVTFVQKREDFERWDEFYKNPHHQYCRAPFSAEELVMWMNKANILPYFSPAPKE